MTLSFHLLKILGQVWVLFPTDTLLLHSTKTAHSHVQVTTHHNLTLSNWFFIELKHHLARHSRQWKRNKPSTLLHHITSQWWKRNVPSTLMHHVTCTNRKKLHKPFVTVTSTNYTQKDKGFEEAQLLAFTQKEYMIKHMKNHAWKVPP